MLIYNKKLSVSPSNNTHTFKPSKQKINKLKIIKKVKPL